jgi:hypothetical protein
MQDVAKRLAGRLGVSADVATRILDELVRSDQLIKGAFRPGGEAVDYTTSDTLQGIRRRTLAALRQEAAPVDTETFVAARLRAAGVQPVPLPHQIIARTSPLVPGPAQLERLREALARLQGLPLPWSVVESFVLPARVPDYRPELLDALMAAGEVVWVGDGHNMCQSYINAAEQFDFELRIACPEGFEPEPWLLERSRARVRVVRNPIEAVRDAHLVATDVWTSMGHEAERERRLRLFAAYQINAELLSHARSDVLFMHCLPAHRGEEVTAEVLDAPDAVVWDEAENRLHTKKALLEFLSRQ